MKGPLPKTDERREEEACRPRITQDLSRGSVKKKGAPESNTVVVTNALSRCHIGKIKSHNYLYCLLLSNGAIRKSFQFFFAFFFLLLYIAFHYPLN